MNSTLVLTSMSDFICNSENCLSWLIILLNIFTIFYLVFCAWFRVTKAVRIAGFVWAASLAIGVVVIVIFHACLFTILSAVFSALVIIAVLSVALNKNEFVEEANGSYVIHKTDKDNYVFAIYDDRKKIVAKSCYKYASIDEAKEAIELCKKNSKDIALEDRKNGWVGIANHPKFELEEKDGLFSFVLSLSPTSKVLKSEMYEKVDKCCRGMKIAASIVKSNKTYFAEQELLSDDMFLALNNK